MIQSNQGAPAQGAGCGARLRQAREAVGLTLEAVSAQLKMPIRVIRVLESDDWSTLDAPVYVRGQLRSYARLLKLDIEAEIAAIRVGLVTPPELVSHTHTSRFRWVAEHAARRAIYIAITAAIVVPVWMATRPHLGSNGPTLQSLDLQSMSEDAAPQPGSSARPAAARTPLVASFGALPVTSTPALLLTFNGDSWVQVFAADGRLLEQGELKAGQSRRYAASEVGRVVLGDSTAVTVEQAGKPVDLTAFSRANVARFTLSSDGSLAPASH